MRKLERIVLIMFVLAALSSTAQDTVVKTWVQPFLKGIELRRSNFYNQGKKMTKAEIISSIKDNQSLEEKDKTQLTNNIEKFYQYRSNKRAFFSLSACTFVLGSGFRMLNYMKTDPDNHAVIAGDSFVLLAIFGGTTVAFTTAGIVNAIKFKQQKRELLKYNL